MTFLTKINGYQKMCDTNKNEMGVIIKGLYYIRFRVSLVKVHLTWSKKKNQHKKRTTCIEKQITTNKWGVNWSPKIMWI